MECQVIEASEDKPMLANALNTIEWNISKRYLAELASQGVDIVPTHLGRAGTLPDAPLYARIDLIRGTTGAYQLMELELIEPALCLRVDEAAPEKFARALDRWWNSIQSGYNDAR